MGGASATRIGAEIGTIFAKHDAPLKPTGIGAEIGTIFAKHDAPLRPTGIGAEIGPIFARREALLETAAASSRAGGTGSAPGMAADIGVDFREER